MCESTLGNDMWEHKYDIKFKVSTCLNYLPTPRFHTAASTFLTNYD